MSDDDKSSLGSNHTTDGTSSSSQYSSTSGTTESSQYSTISSASVSSDSFSIPGSRKSVVGENNSEIPTQIPELKDIVLALIPSFTGPVLQGLIGKCTSSQKEKLQDYLTLDIPLSHVLPIPDFENYWKRIFRHHFPFRNVPLQFESWKTLCMECIIDDLVERFNPNLQDVSSVVDIIRECAPGVKKLRISKLERRIKTPFMLDLAREDFDDKLDELVFKPSMELDFLDFEAVLKEMEHIEEFCFVPPALCDAGLPTADFNSLLRGMQCLEKICKLRISHGIMSSEQIQVLTTLSCSYQFLRDLDLSFNALDDLSCDVIGKVLLSRPLERLILTNNRIGDAGVETLAAAITVNSSLKNLGVSSNRFGNDGGVFLAKSAMRCSGLEVLDVSDNITTGPFGMALANLLHVSPSLKYLNISGCPLGKDTGTAIRSAVEENKVILFLDFNFCGFFAEDEDCIYQNLIRNRREEENFPLPPL